MQDGKYWRVVEVEYGQVEDVFFEETGVNL
jgi:hypothetical protein